MQGRIAVIEDEATIAAAVAARLRAEGFRRRDVCVSTRNRALVQIDDPASDGEPQPASTVIG